MNQNPTTKYSFFGKLSELRKWILVLILGFILFAIFNYFYSKKDSSTVEYDTALIEQQIKNVSKLVVTEGHFAEVMTYKDKKETYIPGLSFEKKAIVIINADVTVAFDMSKVKYDIDAKNKILTITNIPKEEIKISPDIKYFDIQASKFNEFTGDDYNKINKIAKSNLAKKIEKSSLKTNAKNRLVSEISNLLILTKSMGWKLRYNGNEIGTNTEIKL